MHCALSYGAVKRFDMASRRRLFRQDKRKSGNTERTEKNIGQIKLSNHKRRVVDTFQKIMNLADVAIKQEPSPFINSKCWYQEKIVTRDDSLCC